MSDSLRSHRLEPASLLCPWNFPGKNPGVDFYFESNYKLPQKKNLKNKKLKKQKQDHVKVLSESVHQMEKYLQRSKQDWAEGEAAL